MLGWDSRTARLWVSLSLGMLVGLRSEALLGILVADQRLARDQRWSLGMSASVVGSRGCCGLILLAAACGDEGGA